MMLVAGKVCGVVYGVPVLIRRSSNRTAADCCMNFPPAKYNYYDDGEGE